MHRPRPRDVERGYAQWGVCVEESTAIKVGGLLFSPQDPRTYGTETVVSCC